jgi:peptidoglycan-associated lipoprotein
MKMYTHFVLSLLATLAAGCASNSIPDPDPVTEPAAADAGTDGYMSDGHSGGELLVGNTSSELGTVIYFDYDQAELKPEYLDLLARHAARLSAGGSMEIRLEGHADERGSREYNIGLGERRSQSVRRVLIADGVPAAQLSTISFGEERPAVRGSDEQSYSQNRRVVIHYMN